MEEEARDILRVALVESTGPTRDLAAAIRERFAPLGGVELPRIERGPIRLPAIDS
jgi:plasmid stability protein